LAESHAKVRLSQKVELVDVDESWRLYREALKQSATDPHSGKIDVGILTTGLSATARKKRADLIAFIKDILKKKNKTKTIPYQKFFTDVKETSQVVSPFYFSYIECILHLFISFKQLITREQFEDALKELQDDGVVTVMGNTIRVC
jgi:DNA replication licensing factor MCM4